MTNRDLLKEAIADAKAVKEVAIANAKAALEEAFTPHLQSMFEKQITENEETGDEDNEDAFLEELLKELENTELEEEGFGKGSTAGDEGFSTMGEKALDEAQEGEEDADAKDIPEDDDDEEIDIDLDNMTPEAIEKLEAFIEEIVDELKASGEISGEETEEETEEGTEEEPQELTELETGTDFVHLADTLGVSLEAAKNLVVGLGFAMPVILAAIKVGGEKAIKAFKNLATKNKKVAETAEETKMMNTETLTELETGTDFVHLADALGVSLDAAKYLVTGLGFAVPVILAGIKLGGEKAIKAFKNLIDKKSKKDTDDSEMKEQLEEAYKTVRKLKTELSEVNLLNSKLLYTNKIFKAKNLTESQKVQILAAFDKAETVKEAKLVYETLQENLNKMETKKTFIKESKSFASKPVGTSPKQPVVQIDPMVERFQKLAGLN